MTTMNCYFSAESLFSHLALVCAAGFTGASFYINFAEQPARQQLDDRNFLKQWKASFSQALKMQSSLALASSVLGMLTTWTTQDKRWVLGATLMFANMPFTLVMIMPTNRKLMATKETEATPATRALLDSWGKLQAVRTVLSAMACVAYIWALGPVVKVPVELTTTKTTTTES